MFSALAGCFYIPFLHLPLRRNVDSFLFSDYEDISFAFRVTVIVSIVTPWRAHTLAQDRRSQSSHTESSIRSARDYRLISPRAERDRP